MAKANLPEVAVAKKPLDPTLLTRNAIAALGGMQRFVSRGDIVAVKPNIGWDRTPAQAANTNPPSLPRSCVSRSRQALIASW